MIKIDNEFKQLIPPLSSEEYSGLKESILKDGCRDALVLWGDILIDGHNRYEICTANGIEYKTVQMEFGNRNDALEWVIMNQFSRRNLPTYMKAFLVGKLKPVVAEKAKENQKAGGGSVRQNSAKPVRTNEELAKIAGVSHDTIHRVQYIETNAPEELKERCRSGQTSINEAYSMIHKPVNQVKQTEKRAAEEHEAFEESKKAGIVSISEAKQDKENLRLLSLKLVNDIGKAFSSVGKLNMDYDEDASEKIFSAVSVGDRSEAVARLKSAVRILNNFISRLEKE